ncbi:peptidoglycan DD-metalloendopeptidase family protein [Ramlibacter sp. USB13]|uniref:Peptidoglycan DD-metalloendopeptidase family protein n=1 Tax=Ramlibacter cellulosilyticus TaxID=2764187 RepID=A0A923MV48_9BURK|nr:peptidoglycan DD-metalloendopeptidase family protein [Ramlibacter cellulosilyticus]MBC5785843.1 peptidoglycan DD-metalloendopeptidase family protein [Ramlibacter cellulosilyticus]
MDSRACAVKWVVLAAACAVLAGCAAPRRTPAPVEDRTTVRPGTIPAQPAVAALPGAENAGKPGYYTVRPGDTLLRIALESGQNWRDVARWNNLDNPNVIEVGQVLRVAPPSAPAVAAAPAPGSAVPAAPAASTASAAVPPASAASSVARGTATTAPASPAPAPAASGPDDEIAWAWPTNGAATVLAGFDEQKNKGVDIGGRAGDPVLAAADGRVVYAGAGLRGYGNLIILKHNNTYLTAYAHNQSLLVKEDQTVRKGQKIAEMGSTDTDRVKLHFEIRRQGKPVDPTRYLPPR